MKKMVVVGVALVAGLVMGARGARAQSVGGQISTLLQKDVSGVGAEAGLGVYDDFTQLALYGGYSHRGFLEFGLELDYLAYDDKPDEGVFDLTAVGIGSGISYHPLKQDAAMPISFAVDAGVQWLSLSNPVLEDLGTSVTGWGGVLGASLYRFFRLAPRVGVTPSAAVRVFRAVVTAEDEFGDELSRTTGDGVALVLGGNFAFLDSRGLIFGIRPSLTLSDTGVSFGVTFGMIMSLQRH